MSAVAAPPTTAPTNYGAWKSSHLGGGGYVINVILAPSDPKRLYTYIDVGGVYRSDDGGKRWRMLHAKLPVHKIRTITVDPRNANRVIIAAGDQWNYTDFGIYESRDAGETWTLRQKAHVFGNQDYRWSGVTFARDPKNPDVLTMASVGDGVFRSTDGGTTWQKTTGAENTFPSDLKWSNDGKTLVLCAQEFKGWWNQKEVTFASGFYTSTDGGKTWAKRANTAPKEMVEDTAKPGRWYGLLKNESMPVAVSNDNGATWETFTQNLPGYTTAGASVDNGGSAIAGGAASDNIFDAIAVGDGYVVIGSGKGTFYRRGTNDAAWAKIERGTVTENYEGKPWYGKMEPGKWQHFGSAMASVVIDPKNPKRWYFSDWYALYVSDTAGKDWSLSMDGIEDTVLHTLVQDPSDPGVVHMGMADNGYLYSENGGERFQTPRMSTTMKTIAVSPALPNRVYGVGTDTGVWVVNQVFVSIKRGQEWVKSPMEGLPEKATHRFPVIAVDPKNPYTVYVAATGDVKPGGGGVYRSKDGGEKWSWFGAGLPTGANLFDDRPFGAAKELAVGANSAMVAVSTVTGKVFRLEPGAAAWVETKLGDGDILPRTVYTDSKTPGRFFIAGNGKDGGVFGTTDNGKTWKRLLAKPTAYMAVDVAKPNRLAASLSDSIELSVDGGVTWKEVDNRLPNRHSVIPAFAGERLIVGTDGSGTFWMPLSAIGEKPLVAKAMVLATVPGKPGAKPAPAPNLLSLTNGAMTTGTDTPDSWTGASWTGSGKLAVTRDTRTFTDAPASLQFVATEAGSYGSLAQEVKNLRPGGDFTVSASVKSIGAVQEALVAVRFADKDGKQVGWQTLYDAKDVNDWRGFEAKVAVPTDAVVGFFIVTLKGGVGATVYLDAVKIHNDSRLDKETVFLTQ